MGRAPRIFLVGYYGFGNAGDELILRAALADIRAEAPGVEIRVLSHEPEATEREHEVTAVPRGRPDAMLKAVRDSDLVVVGGGGLLQDATGMATVPYYAGLAWAGRTVGRGSAGYALGAGPIRRKTSAWWVRRGFDGAPVSVRDEGSAERLVECGLLRERISVAADPVWSLPLNVGADLQVGPPSASPRRIGIALRPWPGWEDAAEAVARGCRDAFDAPVLAIPFHPTLDRPLAERVARARPGADVADWRNLDGLIAAVAACDLIVTMRYHAGVLAARLGIPFAALSPDGAEGKVGHVARLVGAPLIPALSPDASIGPGGSGELLAAAWGTREAQRLAGPRAAAEMAPRARAAARAVGHAIMGG